MNGEGVAGVGGIQWISGENCQLLVYERGELLSIKRKHGRCIRVLRNEQTNQTTNQQISWSRALIEKTGSSSVSRETPHILWTRRFITVYTKAQHLSLPCARPIQFSSSHPISWRSTLVLSHLRPGLQNGLFRYCPLPPTKIVNALVKLNK